MTCRPAYAVLYSKMKTAKPYIINSHLPREANIETYLHEKSHHEHDDLYSTCTVAKIKAE